MSELHETIMGRKFFMSDFPSLVKNVERVAAALEVQNKAAEEQANPKEKAFPAILIHSTCPLHTDGTTHTGAYRSKIVVEKFDNYLAAQNVMDEELRMVFGWENLPDEPLKRTTTSAAWRLGLSITAYPTRGKSLSWR